MDFVLVGRSLHVDINSRLLRSLSLSDSMFQETVVSQAVPLPERLLLINSFGCRFEDGRRLCTWEDVRTTPSVWHHPCSTDIKDLLIPETIKTKERV